MCLQNETFLCKKIFFSCVDIDECTEQTDDCDDPSRADCSNNAGSYVCSCKAGFSGDGKNCVVVVSFYSCVIMIGFTSAFWFH